MIVVFSYHSIGGSPEYTYSIPKKTFKRHMKFVDTIFDIISVDDLYHRIQNDDLGRLKAVITFDDGYEDNYRNAYPVLKDMEIPASFFLPTNKIGGYLSNSNNISLPLMNWKEVKKMNKDQLFSFYPHTSNHVQLTKLDKHEIIEEIKTSNGVIKNQLQIFPDYFVYPKGNSNQKIKDIVSQFYKLGFCGSGIIDSCDEDKMSIPRFTINNKDLTLNFLFKLSLFILKNKIN